MSGRGSTQPPPSHITHTHTLTQLCLHVLVLSGNELMKKDLFGIAWVHTNTVYPRNIPAIRYFILTCDVRTYVSLRHVSPGTRTWSSLSRETIKQCRANLLGKERRFVYTRTRWLVRVGTFQCTVVCTCHVIYYCADAASCLRACVVVVTDWASFNHRSTLVSYYNNNVLGWRMLHLPGCLSLISCCLFFSVKPGSR